MKIRIVDSLSEYNRKIDEKLKQGNLDKNPEQAIVMTPAVFSKVFSPERIKLLKRLKKNNIQSIYQLAKDLDKPYEVVFRNIRYLEGIGLVKIEKKDRKRIPHLTSSFSIDMFSAA